MSSETLSATSEMEFKALVKPFLKRYASELESAKFLVLLLVKYCLDVRCGIFRWTNLDVKWSIDSLQCMVTVLLIVVFLYFI